MIILTKTETDSILHRHRVYFKIGSAKRQESRLNNQFWLVDFPESADRTADEAAELYRQWLECQLSEQPNGPVATELNFLIDAHLRGSTVEIMTFPCATHGAALVTLLKEQAAERGEISETPSSLLYLSQRQECEEPIQRDNLSIEPDDERLIISDSIYQERVVRIFGGDRPGRFGVKISESEALTVSEEGWRYFVESLTKENHRTHFIAKGRERHVYTVLAKYIREELQRALKQFNLEYWENERELSRPEDRFDPHEEIHFTNTDDGFVEQDHVLAEVDTDQQATQATVMHWFQRRDLMRHQELTELVPVRDGYVAGSNVVHGGERDKRVG